MTVHPLIPFATEAQPDQIPDSDDAEQALAGTTWGGFAMVPKAAVFDGRLTDGEFRKLAAVCVFANKNGDCFPSMERIARQFGLTPRAKRQRGKRLRRYLTRQAIQNGLRKARALGYLRVEPQTRKNGAWRPNLYRVLFPALPPPVLAKEREDDDERPHRPPLARCAPAGATESYSPVNQMRLHTLQSDTVASMQSDTVAQTYVL